MYNHQNNFLCKNIRDENSSTIMVKMGFLNNRREKTSCQNYVLILFVYVRNSHEQLANRHLSITLLVFLDFAKISLEKENIIEMFIEPHPEVKEKQFMILKINTFSLHTYVYMNIFISSTPSTSKNDTKKIIFVSIRCCKLIKNDKYQTAIFFTKLLQCLIF